MTVLLPCANCGHSKGAHRFGYGPEGPPRIVWETPCQACDCGAYSTYPTTGAYSYDCDCSAGYDERHAHDCRTRVASASDEKDGPPKDDASST